MRKLNINKLVNVPTILNNLKTKLDDLNAAKSKTVSIDLRKWRDAVSIEVIKNTKFNTLNTKANNLEEKISDTTTLVHVINTIQTNKIRRKR